MKLKQQDNEIHVPSYFTKGMSGEDKETMEIMFRNASTVLIRIKRLIERRVNDLVIAAEEIYPGEHMEYVQNTAERSGLRWVLKNLLS